MTNTAKNVRAIDTTNDPSAKLARAVDQINKSFPERESETAGLFLALLAGLHALLLGPPGTAKSLLARTFADVVAGGSFWQYLLTKFSSPEELFGPVSFSSLKQDKFERVTTGYLPEAKVIFLDEIFKANSSILNSLLTALNERLFFNGGNVISLPLEVCIGASNEYPEDNGLDALYDRFTLRYWVSPIADRDALHRLLVSGFVPPTETLTNDDITELRGLVDAVEFDGTQASTLLDVKAAVEAEGYAPSDRTWVQVVQLIKARAVLSGRDTIVSSDYTILADVIWKEAKDRPKLAKVIGNAADPYGSRADAIIDECKTLLRELPDLSVLKSGQKTKWQVIEAAGAVSTKLTALKKKIDQVISEAGADNPSIKRAESKVSAAIQIADQAASAALDHQEG